mgnify:CR=1 FL=1
MGYVQPKLFKRQWYIFWLQKHDLRRNNRKQIYFFSKLSDFSSNSFYDYVWWWMFLLHNKAWLELSYFKNFFSSDLVIVVFLCCMVLFCAFKLTRYQFSLKIKDDCFKEHFHVVWKLEPTQIIVVPAFKK